MNDLSTTAIADALGISRQSVMKRAEKERWLFKGTGRDLRWVSNGLPRDVMVSCLGRGLIESPAVANSLKEAPAATDDSAFLAVRDKDRQEAQFRAVLIGLYQQSGLNATEFIAEYNAGRINFSLLATLGTTSVKTFYRWLASWRNAGKSIAALVPQYVFRAARRGPGATLSELAKGYAEYLYLQPHAPTIGHVHRTLEELAAEGLLPEVPSLGTIRRYLDSLPPSYVTYWRKGKTKWAAETNPYIERNMELYRPMDLVTSDHVMIDAVVNKDGVLIRPWVTTVQDYRSGLILGVCPSVNPSFLSITVALFMMTVRYGKAGKFTVDNGKDYRCHFLNGRDEKFKTVDAHGFPKEEAIFAAGAYHACVDEVSFTWTYAGQSKGRQERSHGIWQEYFAKELSSYVGSNTTTRPEVASLLFRSVNKEAKRGDVPTWDEFVRDLAIFLDYWDDRWHSTGAGMDGRTPREVFEELKGEPRMVDRAILELALCRSDKRRVRENGVRVDGVNYYAPELLRYSGTDVLVKRPLANPETALICDERGAILCRAEANYFRELADTTATIERRKRAAKDNLALVEGLSKGRIAPPEGKRSILEISRGRKEKGEDELSLAAGAESDPIPAQSPASKRNAELKVEREEMNAFIDLMGQE